MRIPLGAQRSVVASGVLCLAFSCLAAVTLPSAEATAEPLPSTVLAVAAAETAAETSVRLSNERTYTRWAHPATTAPIRADPLPGAAVLGRLHMLTEDGEPEVYLLLDERTIATGETWVQLRIPGRPNGRIGWVLRGDLGSFHLTHWTLQVALSRLRATLFLDGHATWSAPIGVGSPATPTPTGHYWVRELLRVSGHTLYGPFAFGTSDYSVLSEWPRGGVVGIHGTNQPQLIPGRPSHGCVRMSNTDITYLAHHLPIGAPVNIVA